MSNLHQNVDDVENEITVAIVEDRDDARQGLGYLINGSVGFRCTGMFDNAEEALKSLSAMTPDVILMDIGLPGMDGIEAVRQIKEKWPGIQLMMLTVYEDDERMFNSLKAGATGYVLKKTPPAQLLRNIRSLHEGGSPMSSQIARRLVESFHKPTPSQPSDEEELTPREEEVLQLLAQGFRYQEIADQKFISLDTVRTHIRHIYENMHVR
ncbi:MAG: response regulator transcription factor, partial [Rhodothermales bacterium]|nr:response regulator transcription factor [Rhodothermales bacterium]